MGSRAAAEVEARPDRFWDTYSRYYDCVYELMPYRKLLWDAYEALDLKPGMRVLDAGCGTGNFEHFIAEKNPPVVEIDAVDISDEMLARAREKCAALEHVTFSRVDLSSRLPYPDATFDRIVSINVLVSLADWDATVEEFLRVLKPDGRMVLTSSLADFSYGPVLKDHVSRIGNIWGTRRKAAAVGRTLRALATTGLGSLALNLTVINRRESEGQYFSPQQEAVVELLGAHTEHGLGEYRVGRSMAGQNFLATATKVCLPVAG